MYWFLCLRKRKWHVWCLYVNYPYYYLLNTLRNSQPCVLGLHSKVLVVEGLEGELLWEAARSSCCVWWSWCHQAPGQTCHWPISDGGSASEITSLRKGWKNPPAEQAATVTRKNTWRKQLSKTPRSVKNEKEEVFRPQSRDFPPAHDAACGGGSCAAAAHGAADPPVQLRRDRKASEAAGIQPTTACHDNAGMYYSSNLFFPLSISNGRFVGFSGSTKPVT